MSNIHQLDTMTFTMRSANANIAPTNHMTPPADSTIASAWSSSALGDPATDDEDIADLAELPPDPISPAARRWPLGKNAVVAAAVVAAIGAAAVSVGLAIVTTSGSDQPKPANVVPGAAIVPAPSAPVVAPAVPVAPGAPPVVGQPDSGQPASGAASSPVMPAIRMQAVHRCWPRFLLRPTADRRPPIPAHLRPVGLAARASLSGPMGCR